MREFNLYQDVKTSIEENFFLIKKYGFNQLQEEQLAYEYHFKTINDKNERIDISFEAISSSPIWIKINNIHLEKILEDKLLTKIDKDLNLLYKENFDLYLKFNDTKYLENNIENYNRFGKELNNKKLNRFFQILELNFSNLIKKSSEMGLQVKEPDLCSKEITDLKKLMISEDFLNEFNQSRKLTLETDKCDIEINSIEELKNVLELLLQKGINNIEWKFEK